MRWERRRHSWRVASGECCWDPCSSPEAPLDGVAVSRRSDDANACFAVGNETETSSELS